jgi:hypothetical protein
VDHETEKRVKEAARKEADGRARAEAEAGERAKAETDGPTNGEDGTQAADVKHECSMSASWRQSWSGSRRGEQRAPPTTSGTRATTARIRWRRFAWPAFERERQWPVGRHTRRGGPREANRFNYLEATEDD